MVKLNKLLLCTSHSSLCTLSLAYVHKGKDCTATLHSRWMGNPCMNTHVQIYPSPDQSLLAKSPSLKSTSSPSRLAKREQMVTSTRKNTWMRKRGWKSRGWRKWSRKVELLFLVQKRSSRRRSMERVNQTERRSHLNLKQRLVRLSLTSLDLFSLN